MPCGSVIFSDVPALPGAGLFSVVKADRLLAVGMQRAGYRAGSRRPFQYGARFRSHLSRKTYVDYYLADAARIGTHYLGEAQAVPTMSTPCVRAAMPISVIMQLPNAAATRSVGEKASPFP